VTTNRAHCGSINLRPTARGPTRVLTGGVPRSSGFRSEQMYGGIEYSMNEFAGGWWLNRLYSWLD
jgi:hypothetical protein